MRVIPLASLLAVIPFGGVATAGPQDKPGPGPGKLLWSFDTGG